MSEVVKLRTRADIDEEAASDWVLASSRAGFFGQPEILGVARKINQLIDKVGDIEDSVKGLKTER